MQPTRETATAAHDSVERPAKKFKRRAAQACISCRTRKVRCDVVKGGPCTNCTWDQVECVVRARRPRRSPKALAAAGEKSRATVQQTKEVSDRQTCSQSASRSKQRSVPYTELLREIASLIKEPCTRPCDTDTNNIPGASLDLPPFLQQPRSGISEAAIHYLEASETFTLPTSDVQEVLLKAYLNWVQPLIPITNYRTYDDIVSSQGNISLLVFWGMLSAGSLHVVDTECARLGQADRGELTCQLINKAKALYTVDYENDELARVQGTLLLSMSTDNAGPHEQSSSYWLNVAVSLAKDLGLHRTSSLAGLSAASMSTRKRVWWSCVIRDAELALARCCTPRIHDSGMPVLDLQDFEGYKYITNKEQMQMELTVQRAKLSSLLLETLAFRYSGSGNVIRPDREDSIEKMRTALVTWQTNLPVSCLLKSTPVSPLSPPAESPDETRSAYTSSGAIELQRVLLHLQYQATLGALTRPTTISSTDEAPASFRDAAYNILKLSSFLYQQGRADRYMPSTNTAMTVHALLAHTLIQSTPGASHQERGHDIQQAVRDCIALVEDVKKRFPGVVSQFAARYLESRRENTSTSPSACKAKADKEDVVEVARKSDFPQQQHTPSSTTPTSTADCDSSLASITSPLVAQTAEPILTTSSIPISHSTSTTSPNSLLIACSTATPFPQTPHSSLTIAHGGPPSLISDQVSPPNSDTSVFECLNMDNDAVFDTGDWMELSSEDYWMINDVEQHLNPGGAVDASASGDVPEYRFDAESLLLDPELLGI